ncbi:hypothetical protein HCN44_004810 [Aphidius gifuensis]|uniref:Uncharacterized protein n=1 Tax=Aphidius gifuensis TaxID=684658 RepID=A0A835CM43_APHGI|nr:hypothetical protein HCN44_004810 [Aphidius gifuensis]
MGRKARFSSEVVVKFLIDNIQHFATCVPPWKDPIWKTFSKALATDDAEWKPDTIYNHVKKDRRAENYVLNQSEWNIIKPQPNQSNSEKRTLKKKVWANILLESFWLLYKLPCAFVVDHHYVSNSLNKQFFIKCEGHCKEKTTCNNTFIIIIKDDPGDDPPVINFYTRDTRGELFHEQVKRPCNGSEREKHGKSLQGKAIIPYRRQVARTLMPEGGVESPFIPNPDVLRHAKKEVLDRELGIDSSQKISMFEKIAALRFSPDFNKTIREVGLPFYTFYSTPRQLTLFQEYCKLEKESEICVDASGVFCEELIEPGGKKCGHIFLYVVTIHWGNQTYPVYQMLSTQHNNVFIAHWLKYWHHLLNAPIPKLTVCDYGRALLLALCDTYNSMHLTNYIDLCLDWLLKNNKRLPIPKKINSIMKVDVAHVIHFVTKWKCFKDERGKFLKNTYVRIVALMIDCNDIIKFQELYLLLCVISLQQYEDSVVNISLLPGIKTVQQAYNKLMDYIGNRKVYCDLIEELGDTIVDDDRCQPPEVINSQLTDETTTKKWILKLQTSAMVTIKEGTKLNAYYFKLFMDSFETLANEFPLWTGVMTPFKIEHASSSYGEGYFSYLKNLLLKPYKRPMTVEKFLRVHIRDCEGADIVMGAKVQDYIIKKMRKKIPTGDTIVDNLMEKSDEINNGVAFSNSIYQDNITQSIDLSLDVLNKSNKLVYETWKGRVNNDIHGFGPYDDVNLEYSTIDSDFFHDNRINDVVNSTPVPSGVNDINSSIGLPIKHSTMINEDVSYINILLI